MSRADELRERYEAELAVVELEDELVRLKAEGADNDVLRDCKTRLREARYAFRSQREADAVVTPAAVEAKAAVITPGGEG